LYAPDATVITEFKAVVQVRYTVALEGTLVNLRVARRYAGVSKGTLLLERFPSTFKLLASVEVLPNTTIFQP
jgi:hypothetical protein